MRKWASRRTSWSTSLRHVGNYGEIYEANIGEDTPVGIPRAGTQKRSVDPWRPDLRDALPLIGTFPRARLLRGAGALRR